ncbi:hypothetical protein [Aeromicrobium sp. CF3.5]|uniref:hypothetical protein n=1 Tax=Aeromicrobium sp. CF3.5 TaxID=3373078 RepID=UPI003EE55C7A
MLDDTTYQPDDDNSAHELAIALGQAYDTFLTAKPAPTQPTGEWDTEQILAHVWLVTTLTLTNVATVTTGLRSIYDNRSSQDAWTLAHAASLAGDAAQLRERIRVQAQALGILVAALSTRELAAPVPALLVSNGACLVDQSMSLNDIIQGLAEQEIPGHTRQLARQDA